jgi:hypothetical protein
VIFGVTRLPPHRLVVLVRNGASWAESTISNISSAMTSDNIPNALAFDQANGRLYFASFSDTRKSRLFFVSLANPSVIVSAGKLDGTAAGADFYDGRYCYVNQVPRTDDLRCVTLNRASGVRVGEQLVANVTGNSAIYKDFALGDIAIRNSDGLMYLIWGDTTGKELSSYQIGTEGSYTPVTGGSPRALAKYSCNAFDASGQHFVHDAGTGKLYRGTLPLEPVFSGESRLADLASSALCREWRG